MAEGGKAPLSTDPDKSQVVPKFQLEDDGDHNPAYCPDTTIDEVPLPVNEEDVGNPSGIRTEPEEEPAIKENWNKISKSSNSNDDYAEEKDWRCLHVIARLSVCLLFFCVVLATATISTLSLMLLTSKIHITDAVDIVFKHARREVIKQISEVSLTTDVAWIWSLISVICIPYAFTALGCMWNIVSMKTAGFSMKITLLALIPETAHTVGLTLLVFYILPSFDPVIGMFLTVSVGTLPGLLQIHQPVPHSDHKHRLRFISGILLIFQLGILACFSYRVYIVRQSILLTVLLPVSLLLISVSWWDNYVKKSGLHCFEKLKLNIGIRRPKTHLFVSLWKILLTVSLTLSFFSWGNINCFRTLVSLDDKASQCMFDGNVNLLNSRHDKSHAIDLPFVIASISVCSSILCYKTVKFSCKILAQQLCFATALTLSFLLTFCLLVYSLFYADVLNRWLEVALIPSYSISNISLLFLVKSFTTLYWLPLLLFSLLYLTFGIGLHIWIPKNGKMARTQWLFQKPLYCGALLCPSLILNRNREEQWERRHASGKLSEVIPMIHICATMWREERKEMLQLVKSIFRLDMDQKDLQAAKAFNMTPYEFDAHIFFDDAFDKDDHMNTYVKQLVDAIDEAFRDEVGHNNFLNQLEKYQTPYGVRLIWTLPNDHKLTVHLKNSKLIRKKKRWSQVMFMYYFLKYGILDKKHINETQKEKMATNTYILTLDGDVGFQPDALQILVVRMKANNKIGAVCGRIHPIGSGPMVWYQKFEYAVSHWLQKSTENILGCVLCSPGCFSLFRGSALKADNVMASYTEQVTEAMQKVQFDLGEDRWLCTLLLQQGHRVEYAAASDSYTFAPEGFSEFFKQRRRWTPSTMANIFDLILSWKKTTEKNPEISLLYIIYQLGLFICSVVTPATIFMLVVGALSSAFPDLSLFVSLMINVTPLIIFIILCLKTTQHTQLMFAQVLTLCYCLLMTVVLVGIIKQAAESGFCSVSTMFLTCIAGIFIISALLHPQEMLFLLYGPLYFLMIPCTSMLMMIFAIANINDDSWGTRDSGITNSKSLQNRIKKAKKELSTLARCCLSTEVTDEGGDEEIETGDKADKCEANQENDTRSEPYIHDQMDSKQIPKMESQFWKTLIWKFLSPLDATKEKKNQEMKIKRDLVQLRNNVFLGFILINAVFIILLFSLESIAQYTPNLAFELPCPGDKFKAEKLQPIAVAFTLVFGVVLFIQFIAMVLHRFSTLLQVVVGRRAMLMGCCRSNIETDAISSEDIRRLVNDYRAKNKRQMLKTMQESVSTLELWNKLCEIAVEYVRDVTRCNLLQKIKTNFENLSSTSKLTIKALIEKTDKDIKENQKLEGFAKAVKEVGDGNMINMEQRTIRTLFEGRYRPRQSVTGLFGEHTDDDGYDSINNQDLNRHYIKRHERCPAESRERINGFELNEDPHHEYGTVAVQLHYT